MHSIRSFFGSTDGVNVCGWDFYGGYSVTSDDSHLWHVHISVLRQFADNNDALQDVAAVITAGSTGGTTPPPQQPPASGGTLRRAWPSYMPTDEYFGDINGPSESHGGYYANEQPDVRAIQQRFQALGFAPSDAGWADGLYEQPTVDACAAWQRAKYAAYTTRYGEVWNDDWQRLFTY